MLYLSRSFCRHCSETLSSPLTDSRLLRALSNSNVTFYSSLCLLLRSCLRSRIRDEFSSLIETYSDCSIYCCLWVSSCRASRSHFYISRFFSSMYCLLASSSRYTSSSLISSLLLNCWHWLDKLRNSWRNSLSNCSFLSSEVYSSSRMAWFSATWSSLIFLFSCYSW